jgi:hypothetical protein
VAAATRRRHGIPEADIAYLAEHPELAHFGQQYRETRRRRATRIVRNEARVAAMQDDLEGLRARLHLTTA